MTSSKSTSSTLAARRGSLGPLMIDTSLNPNRIPDQKTKARSATCTRDSPRRHAGYNSVNRALVSAGLNSEGPKTAFDRYDTAGRGTPAGLEIVKSPLPTHQALAVESIGVLPVNTPAIEVLADLTGMLDLCCRSVVHNLAADILRYLDAHNHLPGRSGSSLAVAAMFFSYACTVFVHRSPEESFDWLPAFGIPERLADKSYETMWTLRRELAPIVAKHRGTYKHLKPPWKQSELERTGMTYMLRGLHCREKVGTSKLSQVETVLGEEGDAEKREVKIEEELVFTPEESIFLARAMGYGSLW